jgi:hypothetical protein
MTSIQVLGYAEAHPCTYLLDASYPRSMASPAFLFENSLHAHLEVGGVHSARLTISVPSQGGYYSSSEFLLLLSPTRKADIILGADWLRCCRVSAASNILLSPYEGVSVVLPEGHVWLADGRWPAHGRFLFAQCTQTHLCPFRCCILAKTSVCSRRPAPLAAGGSPPHLPALQDHQRRTRKPPCYARSP